MSSLWLSSIKLRSFFTFPPSPAPVQPERWTVQQARDWYTRQPWLVGANYIPATAINQMEMWQADTFDPRQINRELSWAASLGMNTMRVFLHDLLWQQDSAGFCERIDQFLDIASHHGIRPMLVLFDSCWDPVPYLGAQRPPKPGVHNSGWLQGPGSAALRNPAEYPRLQGYVTGVVSAFAQDDRVLAWDIWNEPCNNNRASYRKQEPRDKLKWVNRLLPLSFEWARAAQPTQPLTSGVWQGDWSADSKLTPIERIQLSHSDIVTFHNYEKAAAFERRIQSLQRFGRPILCTEYMARGVKSTFDGSLAIAKQYNVGAYNWGLVAGKSQTHMPWDSWQKPYVTGQPPIWFHEIFHPDGQPYKAAEVDFIRNLTGISQNRPQAARTAAA